MKKLVTCLLALGSLLLTQAATAQLYDVRTTEYNFDKLPRAALEVDVDGNASYVSDYFQDWMKSNYGIKFKSGGVFGLGTSGVLKAKQVPANAVSGKLLDLYAAVVSPSDSVSRVTFFGGFDEKTFFTAEGTPAEFNSLRAMLQSYASAARTKAYRDMIDDAEKRVRESEKEKERLEKERQKLADDTRANLEKIEKLTQQNLENTRQSRTDSTLLIQNGQLLLQQRQRLQQRRDRMSALGQNPK